MSVDTGNAGGGEARRRVWEETPVTMNDKVKTSKNYILTGIAFIDGNAQASVVFGRLQMNWEQVEGMWKQSAGKVKEKWGKLTDDDLTFVNGKKEQLVGKIQERYGIAKEAAEKQVDEFAHSYRSGKAVESGRS